MAKRTQNPLTQTHQPWKNKPKPWHGAGFYQHFDLEEIDGRTQLGKGIQALKTGLRAYLDGETTVVSELLIQRITYKAIKLAMYESTCLRDPTNEEAPHYLPLSNSLRLDLQALQALAGQSKPPSLDDYLQSTYSSEEEDK